MTAAVHTAPAGVGGGEPIVVETPVEKLAYMAGLGVEAAAEVLRSLQEEWTHQQISHLQPLHVSLGKRRSRTPENLPKGKRAGGLFFSFLMNFVISV